MFLGTDRTTENVSIICVAKINIRRTQGWRLTFTVGYSKIKQGIHLSLYFNVFRKSDLWQDVNDATQLEYFCAQLLHSRLAAPTHI